MTRSNDPVYKQVLSEQQQAPETRKSLFDSLSKEFDRSVVTFFTSFAHPVMIENVDASMLEGVLQKTDLSNGLALVLSSPGGDGLAAERIIRICRTYSGTGEYWAIVPRMAKSAATVICLGASRILMSETSELGPIDPQVSLIENGVPKRFSAYNIVSSYEDLFRKAVSSKGRLEPFLQQLDRYDQRQIAELKQAHELAQDIAVKALKEGMLGKDSEATIRKRISVFLNPKYTKAHARPIYIEDARKAGLNVEAKDVRGSIWRDIYELYIRSDLFVTTAAAKLIESSDHSFAAGAGYVQKERVLSG